MTWIEHPDLPGRKVEVADLSVPHYRAAGWQVVEAPAKPKKPSKDDERAPDEGASAAAEEAPSDASEAKTESEPPKSRRRTHSKED